KARAFPDARFRHSDAGGCARAIALSALDVPESDPMDLTGVWNTRLGTLVHDAWQEVLRQRFPGATVETRVRSANGEGAGHIDAVVRIGLEEDREHAGDSLVGEGGPDADLLDLDGSDDSERVR